jgi:hypothetical protein
MIKWSGHLITGERGAAVLALLSETANAQALSRAIDATGGEYSRYEPWMSNASKRSVWVRLQGGGPLVPEVERLRLMKAVFHEGGPLRAIHPDNIAQEVDCDARARAAFCSTTEKYIADLITAPDYGNRLSALLRELIPLTTVPGFLGRSDGEGLSSQLYQGGVFIKLAEPSDHADCENLLNLVHELGHQALNLILNSDPLICGDVSKPVYSVIRKTFRPGIMSFHALAAVAYMLELILRAPELFYATSNPVWVAERIRNLRSDMELGLATVREMPLTQVGRELVEEFESLLQLGSGSHHAVG